MIIPNVEKIIEVLALLPDGIPLQFVEYAYIKHLLIKHDGNRIRAAKDAKIALNTLRNKMREMSIYNITVPDSKVGTPIRKDSANVKRNQQGQGMEG